MEVKLLAPLACPKLTATAGETVTLCEKEDKDLLKVLIDGGKAKCLTPTKPAPKSKGK